MGHESACVSSYSFPMTVIVMHPGSLDSSARGRSKHIRLPRGQRRAYWRLEVHRKVWLSYCQKKWRTAARKWICECYPWSMLLYPKFSLMICEEFCIIHWPLQSDNPPDLLHDGSFFLKAGQLVSIKDTSDLKTAEGYGQHGGVVIMDASDWQIIPAGMLTHVRVAIDDTQNFSTKHVYAVWNLTCKCLRTVS